MANINKDYLVIVDVKKSSISLGNGSMTFNILDKNTSNIFVNLVINTSTNELIHRFTNIENAEDYTVVMNIVKPNNEYLTLEGELRDKEKAVFEFNLPAEAKDVIGTYNCELLTKCNINGQEEVTTSNKVSYRVKESVLNNLDDVITEAPTYPIVIELFDRLSDIERYEEDRRQAEIARGLAETARVEAEAIREQEHDVAMQDIEDKIVEVEGRAVEIEEQIEDKIVEVEGRFIELEAEVDRQFQERDKTIVARFTQHENVVADRLDDQDEAIGTFINDSTARMDTHEQTVSAQIAEVQAKDREQDERMTAIEVVNSIQDGRLDKVEKKNKEQDYTLACLFAETDRAEINFDGNSEQLLNSKDGLAIVNSFKGNTMVNLNKDADKSLVLNGNIDKTGQVIDVTEGADGGLVDVYLEGNTMVNVCDQEDSVPLTMSYTVETGNHVAFRGDYDGKAKPYVYGNTLVNLAENASTTPFFTCGGTTVEYSVAKNNDGSITINASGELGIWNYACADYVPPGLLKPNTTYTAIFDRLENVPNIMISNQTADTVVCEWAKPTGNMCVFTTKDTIPDNGGRSYLIYCGLSLGVTSTATISKPIFLEGDYTNKPIPNYFEGLQSSFEDQVVPTNLMNDDWVTTRMTCENGHFRRVCDGTRDYGYIDLPIEKCLSTFKSNGVYTLIVNVTKNTLVEVGGQQKGIQLYSYNSYNSAIDSAIDGEKNHNYACSFTAGEVGTKMALINMKDFDNPSSPINKVMRFSSSYYATSGEIEGYITLIEGDVRENPPTYEEVTEHGGKYKVDYVSVGKNLFNVNEVQEGYYQYSDIETGRFDIATHKDYKITEFIELKPNTTYTKNFHASGAFYDGNKEPIKTARITSNIMTFTTPNNCAYAVLSIDLTRDVSQGQIEEGDTATAYEPFRQTTKTLYLNSPLLEGDSIEVQGNNIVHVHRYGKILFDGSQKWENKETYQDIVRIRYWLSDRNCKHDSSMRSYSDNIICTLGDEVYEHLRTSNGFIWYYNTNLDMTEEDVKQVFANKPTEIVYPLATPQYEVISSNDNLYIDSYANGHLDFDSAVPVEKVYFADHGFVLKYLKPSTEYVVQFEADGIGKMNFLNLGEKLLSNLDIVKGINKFTITTLDNIKVNRLFVFGIGCNISNIVVTEATDMDFGYFQGMKSVGECEELEVLSHNMRIDNSGNKRIDINVGDGSEGVAPNRVTSTYNHIFLDDDQVCLYTKDGVRLSGGNSEYPIYNLTKRYYDKEKNYLGADYVPNAYYVRFRAVPKDNSYIFDENTDNYYFGYIGDVGYVPQQSQTQQLTHEPLRAVGDVKDRYVLIDGEWYIERNCREVILDGSSDEIWYHWTFEDFPDGQLFRCDAITDGCADRNCRTNIISNSYLYVVNHKNNQDLFNGCICMSVGGYPCIADNSCSTTADLKAKLQQNPIKVIYHLANPTYEKLDYNPFSVYKDMTHITTNSTIPANLKVKNHGFNALLKPSTTYTISSSQGVQTFQTGATLDDSLRLYGTGTMKDVTILEGAITDTDLIPSHFSGIESAFEQTYDEEVGKYKVEIKTTGKNLWKYGDEIPNGIVNHRENELILRRGHTYTISCREYYKQYDKYPAIIFFNAEGKVVYYSTLWNAGTVTLTDDVPRIALYSNDYNYNASTGKPMTLKGLMIEEGTQATTYEPYKSSTISFYLDEPLRGVGNVRDRVFIEGGKVKVERKCGKVALDGDEIYTINTTFSNDNYITFSTNSFNGKTDTMLYCDNIPYGRTYGNTECINIAYSTFFYITVSKSKLSTSDVNGFKQWLQENPTTVVYELETPTVEVIELDKEKLFLESYKDGHISFNSNIPVMDTWVEYSVAVAMLNNMLETASITDEQDFLIVDMATQLAIMQLTM